MATTPPRLLRRTQLYAGESLSSLIERLTLLNGYERSDTILKLCRVDRGDSVILPRSHEWLLRLSALSGIEYDALYASTGYNYAGILPQPSSRGVHLKSDGTGFSYSVGRPARYYFEADKEVKFCPACLKKVPYHRLVWTLKSVSVCVEHRLLLANVCPVCRNSVNVEDVIRAECHSCGANFTKAEPKAVGKNTFGLISQRIIQSWFTGNLVLETDLPWPLPNQPPVVLYRVLVDLHGWIGRIAQPSFTHQAPKPPRNGTVVDCTTAVLSLEDSSWANYKAWTTAFKGIANWPEGFHELLATWAPKLGMEQERTFTRSLQETFGFHTEFRWREPTYTFIRTAFHSYMISQYNASHQRYLLWSEEEKVARRKENLQQKRLKEAHFPIARELDNYDFSLVTGVNRGAVLDLERGDYIRQRHPVILIGNSGVGKTHIAIGLARSACRQGYRVRFWTAADFVSELLEAQAERRLERMSWNALKFDLLVLDGLGAVPITPVGAQAMFSFCSTLCDRRALIVTSHLILTDWVQFLGDERLTANLLGRLTHQAHIIELLVESSFY